MWGRFRVDRAGGDGDDPAPKIVLMSAALSNTAARASARSCLEDVIRGGEGGSISYVVLVVEEDAELEGRGCVS